MKKNITKEQLIFIMADDFCANCYIPQKHLLTKKKKKQNASLVAPRVANYEA